MEDTKIVKMAVITSIMGLLGMMFLSGEITPKKITIDKINQENIDQEVMVECYVEEIKKSANSNTYMLTIMDGTAKTTLIIFESTTFELEKNGFPLNSLVDRKIRVIGTVSQYHGAYEIILKDYTSIKLL
jgi:DNA/RNA endonuclease YhcR with UshA esterase domain